MERIITKEDYQNDEALKKYNSRINRYHIGVIFWRMGVCFSLLLVVLMISSILVSITSIVLFLIGLTILGFIVLITLGTIFILDPNHGKHWENLFGLLESNDAALNFLAKVIGYVPIVTSVVIAINLLSILLLYTSKLPVRRYRLVTSIVLIIVNIAALIYTLVGGK